MTNPITEGIHAGEYIVSEANGNYSREVVTVTGADLGAATVLGKVTASGKYAILAPAAADGTETAAAVLYDTAKAAVADAQQVAHVRACEVNGLVLVWPDGISAPQKAAAIADLAAAGIIVRT